MAVHDSGSRKHKFLSPKDKTPNKHLKHHENELPGTISHTAVREPESPRARQERRMNLYPCDVSEHENTSFRPETSGTLFSGRRRSRLQCNNESEECAEDLRPSPKNTPHGRTHRAQAPSMLFRKAFNDIIGKPVRSKLPSKTESNSLQEIKSVEESNWPILEEPVPVTHTAEKRYSSETVRESSSGKKVNDEPSYQSLNSSRIITDRLPELVTDYDQVDTGRLVFLYEDESDKDVGTEEDLAKDPSIGSDFSDLEDVGSLARFSQEDLTSCCAKGEDICTTGSGYVMYQSSWCNYTEPAGSSPVYRPSTEQNTWHQEESNSRHISDHSVNAVENSVLSVSSDSDSTGSRRRERSDSFDIPWTYENTTKMVRRRSETRCPTDFSRSPKFLEDGFIDTHCHLDMLFSKLLFRGSFADFRNDYNTTFPREFQGCITDFCNPGTLQDRLWERLMGEDMVWGAFGCHPHFAQYYTDEKQEWIMNALRHPKAVAYGEMGLDYSHKCSTLIPVQHQVFEKQLKLAVSLGKPLVIHCRDADEDLFEIMKRLVPWDYKIHRHCFTGSYRQIEPFLKEFPNMAVGFTALLTYSSALEAQDAMRQIPLERLIVETDAPYFLPRKEAALQDFQELAAKLPWEKALSAWELNNSLKKKKRRKKQGDGGKERKQPGVSTGVDVLGEEEQGNTEKHCEDSSTIKCLEEKKAGVTKELDPTVPDTTVEDVQAKGSEKLPECPSSQAQSVEEVQSSQHLGSDAATQPVTEVKPEVKECDGEADTLPITEVKTGGKEGDLNGDASNVLKFRVTCNRAGDKHSFTSNEVEMWFGGAIQEHFQWKADMTNFDVEVLPNISFRELLVGIALTEKSFNRKNITHFGPQTLPPTLVYGMLRLCDLQPSDVIIDLMCGTGAIPIEGVSEWPGCFFLAGDNNTQAVSRTASNINSLLRKQQSQESAPQGFPIDVAQWDISSLPLRSGSVDAIVMVIPFGRWIDSKKYWDLYPAWLQEMSRVCRAGTGRAVVFAYNRTYFFKALAKAGHLWKKMHTVWVNIGGLHAGVYLLKRTAHDAHECSRERQEEDRPADTVSSSKAE